jgi:hypothetical protein
VKYPLLNSAAGGEALSCWKMYSPYHNFFYVLESCIQYLFVGICVLLYLYKIEVLGTVKRDRCPDEQFLFPPLNRVFLREYSSERVSPWKRRNVAKMEGLCAYPALIREDNWFPFLCPFLGLPTEIKQLILVHIAYFSDNCEVYKHKV